MRIQIRKVMSLILMSIFVTFFVTMSAIATDSGADDTVFEMPNLDVEKEYTYNTVFDYYVPDRLGEEAVLYWGDKAKKDKEKCIVSKIEKLDGEEIQYFILDAENEDISLKGITEWYNSPFGLITFMDLIFSPASLLIDYPLWDGKEWYIDDVTFSGTIWTGQQQQPLFDVPTSRSTEIIGEEYIAVPAGIAHCLVLETTMTSYYGMGQNKVNKQIIWLMENGFFAKRKLFHVEIIDDDLVEYPVEDLELMEPIIATVDIKPEIFDRTSEGKFTAFIKLPDNYDVATVDFTTCVIG